MHSLQCIVYEMLTVQLQDREFLSSTTQYFSFTILMDPMERFAQWHLILLHWWYICNWVALVALVLNNSPEWLAY